MGFTDDQFKTKKCTMYQYKQLHGGSQYMIHEKYSRTLVALYIAFTYGLGIPILFPIACLTFVLQWLCDRFMVARYYPVPPAMSNQLSQSFFAFVEFAPVIMIINGFWMLNNSLIFENEWKYLR